MRRADRLFQIVQRLRRRSVTTARDLAEALGVSERTIYRDVQDLILSGVPVQGEAGVGYALPKGFDLPPLMFSEEEIEALTLGARIVKAWSDPALQRAADDALAKIEQVLPTRLQRLVPDAALFAPAFHVRQQLIAFLPSLREAVRKRHKIRFGYSDRADRATARTVQPLGLFYWGHAWSLGAWCELREGFRNFRVDRMREVEVLDETFADTPGRTLADFFKHHEAELNAQRKGD